MSDLESIIDRQEITDLIARYAVLVDSAKWDEVGALFRDNARIDFTTFGAPIMTVPELVKFLADSLGIFKRTQHLMGLPVIDLDGDTATARTPCTNPMVIDGHKGTQAWLIGLWYDDELARTPDGWRFTSRTQDRCYTVTSLLDTPLS